MIMSKDDFRNIGIASEGLIIDLFVLKSFIDFIFLSLN